MIPSFVEGARVLNRMVEFLKTALKHYAQVGAVTELSKYVADRVLREIEPGRRCLMEFGAGNGALTRRLLSKLAPEGRLVAVELLGEFAEQLFRIKDPRLTVIQGDVRDVLRDFSSWSIPPVEVAVSNIPFSLMSDTERLEVARLTEAALAEQGVFVVFQNVPIVAFQLRKFFPEISWSFELRNLPPYFILAARKRRGMKTRSR